MRPSFVPRLLLVAIAALFAALPACAQAKRIVAYYPEWSVNRKYYPGAIPADRLTHVNYAFARIENGEIAVGNRKIALEDAYENDGWRSGDARGAIRQLHLLKQRHPHLRTLISVGGWTMSGGFSDSAATQQAREKFARSCVEFVTRYDFDGVDLDWEFPGGGGMAGTKSRFADPQNFTLLLAEVRRQFDARGRAAGRTYLLTIAAPAGPAAMGRLDLDKIHPHVDWINLMAYDFAGGWSERTAFHAPLYAAHGDPRGGAEKLTVDAAVRAYLAAGVPADKVVLGIPFYGRGWLGVGSANNGLFQKPAREKAKETWAYRELMTHPAMQRAARFWNDDAKAPWLYDERTKTMITYDDPRSVAIKAEYVVREKLGGAMIWELTADDGTLLPAIERVFKGQ